jgi:hypothetical protein
LDLAVAVEQVQELQEMQESTAVVQVLGKFIWPAAVLGPQEQQLPQLQVEQVEQEQHLMVAPEPLDLLIKTTHRVAEQVELVDHWAMAPVAVRQRVVHQVAQVVVVVATVVAQLVKPPLDLPPVRVEIIKLV